MRALSPMKQAHCSICCRPVRSDVCAHYKVYLSTDGLYRRCGFLLSVYLCKMRYFARVGCRRERSVFFERKTRIRAHIRYCIKNYITSSLTALLLDENAAATSTRRHGNADFLLLFICRCLIYMHFTVPINLSVLQFFPQSNRTSSCMLYHFKKRIISHKNYARSNDHRLSHKHAHARTHTHTTPSPLTQCIVVIFA